jgi:hypothetical protein
MYGHLGTYFRKNVTFDRHIPGKMNPDSLLILLEAANQVL